MSKLDFIKKLYNGRNCYSDHMGSDELALLHIESKAEAIVDELLKQHRIVFLTGNPGDGKTFIIKAIEKVIDETKAYCETDLNNVGDYTVVAKELVKCYAVQRPAIVAVNEYPFLQLLKCIKQQSLELYEDIQHVRHNVLAYGVSSSLHGRAVVVDLNERNMLGPDYGHLSHLVDKMVAVLAEEEQYHDDLKYNLTALSQGHVKKQLLSMFELAAAECEHFAVRDILGALAFTLTACTTEDYAGHRYYTALFEGSNELLRIIQQYDPVRLTDPTVDEALWNGEVVDGWILSVPDKYPKDYLNVDEAVECFKQIKRQFYFENKAGKKLMALQPAEISEVNQVFLRLEQNQRDIKHHLILALNKLFLPSSNEKRRLYIWTTHRYDISMDAAVAVSSKSVDAGRLELLMPRPADWLKGLEFCPDHVIMKPKNSDKPRLILNVDFLRTLHAVENGYPIGLLAPQYEQAASIFLQQLDDDGFAEDNDDGEIVLASRNQSFHKRINIQDGKYGFGEED